VLFGLLARRGAAVKSEAAVHYSYGDTCIITLSTSLSSSHSRLNDLVVSLLAGTDLRPSPASHSPVDTLVWISGDSLGCTDFSELRS